MLHHDSRVLTGCEQARRTSAHEEPRVQCNLRAQSLPRRFGLGGRNGLKLRERAIFAPDAGEWSAAVSRCDPGAGQPCRAAESSDLVGHLVLRSLFLGGVAPRCARHSLARRASPVRRVRAELAAFGSCAQIRGRMLRGAGQASSLSVRLRTVLAGLSAAQERVSGRRRFLCG